MKRMVVTEHFAHLSPIARPDLAIFEKENDMTRNMITATVLAALIPVGAYANFAVGDTVGTDLEEIRAQFEAQGYNVMEIELEGDEIEVEYTVDGQEYEVEIDVATGMVLEVELEDDDDDDDWSGAGVAGMTGRVPLLWVLFGVQAFCAVYFAFDAVIDILGLEQEEEGPENEWFEYVVALSLFLGVVMTGRELKRLMNQNRKLSEQVRAASGEFHKLVEDSFDAWGLTASERDVAMFSIKGLSIAEIAAARGSSEGTIKAHSAAVYRKAGVSGRHQLLSHFVDDLIETPVAAAE